MKRVSYGIGLMAVVGLALSAQPAAAQLQYGPWVNTNRCEDASPPVGVGRKAVKLPRAVGGQGAKECLWVRQVIDCPRLRDKVLHPGKCTGKVREQKEWSIGRPLD
jgi:hypothetical protein